MPTNRELQAEVSRLRSNNKILQSRIDKAYGETVIVAPEVANDVILGHVEQLGEFFDTILIHCASYHPEMGTFAYHLGSGCAYSRKALAEEYLDRDFADVLAGSTFVTEYVDGEEEDGEEYEYE